MPACTLGAAVGRLHDRLEQRAEDGRRNRRPVELSGVEQCSAHLGIEVRDADRSVACRRLGGVSSSGCTIST